MRRIHPGTTLAVLCAMTAACGGGSDPAQDPGGGPAVTRGAITEKSGTTIQVNGVVVDDRGATVRIEGSPGTEASLQPGMIVTVRGTFDDRTGTATEIEFEDAVKGRVSSKGADGVTVNVGGRTVRVDDSTHFDDSLRLASVSAGDRVRVSGVPDDKGGLRATRIDKLAGTSEDFEVKGFVSALSASGFTLRTSPDLASEAFQVTYAAGVTPPAGLANGSIVEVRAAGPAVAGALVATAVVLEDRLGSGSSSDTEVEVEGIVTSGTSSAFTVAGQSVVTNASTRWLLGDPAADFAVGSKVEAEGHLDGQGVLVAHKVEFRAVARLEAAITGFTATGTQSATLTILGVPVALSPLTDYRAVFGSLGNGSVVELRGIPLPSGTVMATRVDASNNTRIFLRGLVTAKDATAGTLTVLGKTVTTAASELRDLANAPMARAAFFAAVEPGRTVVRARGRDAAAFSDPTFTAEEVELEGDR